MIPGRAWSTLGKLRLLEVYLGRARSQSLEKTLEWALYLGMVCGQSLEKTLVWALY